MYKEKETLMVHWWERLSPINVALDRFRPGATCGSSLMLVRLPCFESFSQGFLVFLPSQKPTQFKFQLDQDIADPLRCIWLLHWYKYCFFFSKISHTKCYSVDQVHVWESALATKNFDNSFGSPLPHRGSTATLTMWLWRNSWSITGQTHRKLTSIC